MTLDSLEEKLASKPHQIHVNIVTEPALNGYGMIRRYEVVIDQKAVRCRYCKLVDPVDNWCAVNDKHLCQEDWRQVSAGAGYSLTEALDMAERELWAVKVQVA